MRPKGLSDAWPINVKGRLMLTMAAVASERGYAVTRVSDLLEPTGISRRTFYVYFDNREDCFFATYRAIVADIDSRLASADSDVRGLLDSALDYFISWPAHARVLLIEILSAGPAGAQRHEETMNMLAARLASCQPWQPGQCDGLRRQDVAQAAVGAMLRVVQHKLITEGPTALPALLPGLATLVTQVRVAA